MNILRQVRQSGLWIICLLAFLISGGCAMTQQDSDGLGMGTTKICINGNMATMSFRPHPLVPERYIEDYLLYRLAEVTIDNSFDYFVIKYVRRCPWNYDIFHKPRYKQYLVDEHGVSPGFLKNKTPYANYRCIPECKKGMAKVWIVIKMFHDPWSAKKVCPAVFDAQEIVAYIRPDIL